MRAFLFLIAVAALSVATVSANEEETRAQFAQWMTQYQRSYANGEAQEGSYFPLFNFIAVRFVFIVKSLFFARCARFLEAFANFKLSIERVKEMSVRVPTAQFELGKFADLTPAQFKVRIFSCFSLPCG